MAVYDANGNGLSSAYNTSGNSLSSAYDVNGNGILDTTGEFKLMTYNVQWFEGRNGIQAMQDLIIATYSPDVIGLQEVYRHRSDLPPVGIQMLSDYRNLYISTTTNPDGLASKFPLEDVVMARFTAQDPADVSNSDERGYMKAYFRFGNARICWLNTHLAYITAEYKHQQMMELFAMAENEEYCILTGDFNSYGTKADFDAMYKPFVSAGYHLANFAAEDDFTKTFSSSATPTNTSEMTHPHDNLICSGSLSMKDVVFSPIKFQYQDGNAIDHIPIIATISVGGTS